MLWDLNEGKHLYTLDSGDTINALCFSPNRYWLCAATGPSIKIWVNNLLLNTSWAVCGELKLMCKVRWWNFQCQLYSLMIKRLFLSSILDIYVPLWTFWMHSFLFLILCSLCPVTNYSVCVCVWCLFFSFLLIQDLEGKIIVDELRQEVISTNSKAEPPQCTSLAWSADGQVKLSSLGSFSQNNPATLLVGVDA